MNLDDLKQHFVYIFCTNQFDPKTEDTSSDKELKQYLDTNLIL